MSTLPVATVRPLSLLPALSPAAAAALDVAPAEILRRWFAGLGESARTKYGLALRQFETWATGTAEPRAETALRLLVDAGRVGARQLVLGWRESMEAAGKASGTVAGSVSALASLVTAARLCGLVEWHLEAVAPKIEARHDRSGPPRHAVEHLLAYLDDLASHGDRKAVRDVALVRLLHNCAFRRNEVVTLRIGDVQIDHPDGPRAWSMRKGKKEREPMLLGRLAAASLRAWLQVRGTDDAAAPVFVRTRAAGEKPTRLCGDAIRRMLATRAKESGMRGPCRPHGLRHSAASHCARNASLAALKRLGGWTTLSSPSKYLDKDDADRRTALQVVEC